MSTEDATPARTPILLPTRDGYVPIAERLNQDVWHDNFVPKYSAIASAEPSRIVLIGVWMIFGPMAMFSIMGTLALFDSAQGVGSWLGVLAWSVLYGILPITLLWKQTIRYVKHRRQLAVVDDET